ncbi:MAG TPA: hypothetical protein VF728_07405 [Nocardioides sp.]
MNTTQGNAPCCHWVPVTGADGRVHMEMRWVSLALALAPATPATPHAA